MTFSRIVIYILCLGLVACSSTPNREAPVVEGWQGHDNAEISDYRVQPGDTIYSVAWGFGMDYHDIARYNQLTEPYTLRPGQTLRMSGSDTQTYPAPATVISTVTTPVTTTPTTTSTINNTKQANPVATPPVKTTAVVAAGNTTTHSAWQWPTQGPVIHGYSSTPGGNRGIDIGGKLNQTVVSSAEGKVVYAGSGMAGYGNLIIIKHNDTDLSAYAFNKKIYVKEGDKVSAGQRIASMGKNDAGQVSLHFEIRRNGKPIDPLSCLPPK